MQRVERILLTTDFSDTSKRAFAPAVTLAKKFGATIFLAYVEEDRLPPLVVEYMAVGVDEILTQQMDRATERLRESVAEIEAEVRPVEALVAMGTPHVEIVRLAEQHDVDLIVIATHGRGFISHAILGSTAERVLRRAPCPVLVVRDPVVES